jgi:hypothetical protein
MPREDVGSSKAASLLQISPQRLRKLLSQGRVKGAYKGKYFWKIPLFNEVPKVIEAKRGPKGLWYRSERKSKTNIYINKDQIRKNGQMLAELREPVIVVEQGKRKEYGYEVEIAGPCRVVYSPDRALHGENRTNPVVWIETNSQIKFLDVNEEPHKCRLPYQQLPTAKKKPVRRGFG